MSTTSNSISVTKKYTHSSKEEFMEWSNEIEAKMKLTKARYDTVMLNNALHPSVVRQLNRECKTDGITEGSHIDAYKAEYLGQLNEEAYAILYVNIGDKTLKGRLTDDFKNDAHAAFAHIQEKWAVAGNDTRIHKVSA